MPQKTFMSPCDPHIMTQGESAQKAVELFLEAIAIPGWLVLYSRVTLIHMNTYDHTQGHHVPNSTFPEDLPNAYGHTNTTQEASECERGNDVGGRVILTKSSRV